MASDKPKPNRRRSPLQFLHVATGDRYAEARSLDARTSDTSTVEDAQLAVARAYGETADEPATQEHVASVGDAEHAHEQRDEREVVERETQGRPDPD